MASSSDVISTHQSNGSLHRERFIDSIDPDDPVREKELMKPVEVREDMKQMEARARVSQILSSQAFREQLEEIIESQLRSGPHLASNWVVPQQLLQLVLPAANPSGSLRSTLMSGRGPVAPVADIRGINSALYSKGERTLRCKVAAVHRLVDLFGWVHGVNGHISARASEEHFLVNPYGLMYNEMTAGSLVKVDANGAVVDPGSTSLNARRADFVLHLALYAAQPDVTCIIHLLASSALAVSLMKCGLLPISQEAMTLGDIAYINNYDGVYSSKDDHDTLVRNIDSSRKVIFIRNHGMLVCGSSVEEAIFACYTAMAACDIQVRIMPLGLDNIVLPSEEARQKAAAVGGRGSAGVNTKSPGTNDVSSETAAWKAGELEFEAWMRLLDSAGYRTGYIYKQLVLRKESVDKTKHEAEVSVSTTSALQYYENADKLSSPRREALDKQKKQHKVHWLSAHGNKREGDMILQSNAKNVTKEDADHHKHSSNKSASSAVTQREDTGSSNNSHPTTANSGELSVSRPQPSTVKSPRPKSDVATSKDKISSEENLLLPASLTRTASDGLRLHASNSLTSSENASINGNGKSAAVTSPDKSATATQADKKKKKKFRIPSFAKNKDEKKEKSKSLTSA